MEIDSSIPLSVKSPVVENPQDAFSRTMSLADMMQRRQLQQQQMQENELKMTQQRNAMADDDLMGKTIAKNTAIGPDGQPVINHPAIIQTLAAAGKGHLANTYTQSMIAQQRAALEDHSKQFDLATKKLNTASELLGPVANYDLPSGGPEGLEATFQNSRRAMAGMGILDATVPKSMLNADGATVNPDAMLWAKNTSTQVLKAKEQADLHREQLTAADTHIKSVQDIASGKVKDLGEQLKIVSQQMSAAGPDNWQARRLMLEHGGVSPDVMKQVPTEYSDAAQEQMATANMTAAEREQRKIQQQNADNQTSEGRLARQATYDPTKTPQQNAEAALRRLDQSRLSSRPVTNLASIGGTANDPKDIAAAIIRGDQPPDMKGLYRFGGPVKAELARQGYDLSTANRDWTAINRFMASMNGPQQLRLQQAVSFAYDSVPLIEQLYADWKREGTTSGIKVFNRASLATAKNLPGAAGAAAQALETQLNDFTSELGTVYKGGNSSTDESLKLAASNLKSEWNDETFSRALKLVKSNLGIRRNSILNSVPAGITPGSPYAPPTGGDVQVPSGGGRGAPSAPRGIPKPGDIVDGRKLKANGDPNNVNDWEPVGNPNPNGYIKGHVYGGMTFLGGDPNVSASWKK